MNRTSPIGVIDSGIGGFSVAKKVQELLPWEDILYFGDGANTPYGNHDADTILAMTRYMLGFMRQNEVKLLLVACNTISCLMDSYRDEMDCPVLSVVEAGAQAAANLTGEKIGVVSTCFTHQTGCYPKAIHTIAPQKQVFSKGCANLAHLVETYLGREDGQEIIRAEVQTDLEEFAVQNPVDCCVLGCTHFPLVREEIDHLFPHLMLLDPAEEMVATAHKYLQERGEEQDHTHIGQMKIMTTGDVEEYAAKAKQVGLINIISVDAWPPMQKKW